MPPNTEILNDQIMLLQWRQDPTHYKVSSTLPSFGDIKEQWNSLGALPHSFFFIILGDRPRHRVGGRAGTAQCRPRHHAAHSRH
eukprot:scaffold434_cov186-Pinguiococcus_pyrenoidosus.AAC.84